MTDRATSKPRDAKRHPLASPEGERLLPTSEHLELRIEAYYSVLNRRKRFQSALSDLLQAWSSTPDDDDLDDSWRPQRIALRATAFIQGVDDYQDDPWESEPVALLVAFIQTWALPRDRGAADLVASFSLSELGWPLSLAIGAEPHLVPDIGGPVPQLSVIVGSQPDPDHVPVIVPLCLLPFVYDPRHPEPEWARRFLGHPTPPGSTPTMGDPHWVTKYADKLAQQLRNNIRDQATALEKEVAATTPGWTRLPSRHRDPESLYLMALRLYQRAVLHRSWTRIAKDESHRVGHYVDPESIRKTVTDWATDLHILLRP